MVMPHGTKKQVVMPHGTEKHRWSCLMAHGNMDGHASWYKKTQMAMPHGTEKHRWSCLMVQGNTDGHASWYRKHRWPCLVVKKNIDDRASWHKNTQMVIKCLMVQKDIDGYFFFKMQTVFRFKLPSPASFKSTYRESILDPSLNCFLIPFINFQIFCD